MLETLADALARMDARIERGFDALADDTGDLKHEKATRHLIVALHGQVSATETQLPNMKHAKLHARVADLEEKGLRRRPRLGKRSRR